MQRLYALFLKNFKILFVVPQPSMTDSQATSNTFTDEGRLLQAEYAIKNVNKAGTIAGIVCKDGVVLLGINPSKSATLEKIYALDSNTYCAVAGIFSDALRLVKYARLSSANIHETLGQCPRTTVLCDKIGAEKQRYTQYAGSRPFGVSFLYSGYEKGEYVLCSTDPSGTVGKWTACAFGSDDAAINSKIINDIENKPYTLEEGVRFLFKCIGQAREWTTATEEKMEVLLYKKEGSRIMKVEEIKKILDDLENEKIIK
jgi:20S proteasome subunit alpha 3